MTDAEGTAVEPAPKAERFALLAENATHAKNSARDWAWTKTETGWIDHHGVPVDFLADEDDLLASLADSNTVAVYQGYRWYAAIRPHMLDNLVKAKRVRVLIEPPKLS